MVHLGRNPITSQGWEFFKNCFTDESTVGGEASLTHLSVNMLTESGSPASGSVKYIHPPGASITKLFFRQLFWSKFTP
jgi:hypothetical protein